MMKKILTVLLGLCLSMLSAAATSEEGAEDVPVLSFNPETLAKPSEIPCLQWLEILEVERNKADYLGNFQAFKSLTKEISATIGGKYGFAIPTTQDEIVTLSYSIIRTRHKFCGKLNMLSDFYGIKTAVTDPQTQQYLAMVLAIDAMTFEAVDEEGDTFFDQWSAVNATDPTTEAFVAAVKECVQLQEKKSLITALDEALINFLTTDSATITLAKEVFDIFAPKITLKKIYTEMIGGEYRGWTVHGVNAFAYPISLHPDDVAINPKVESDLRTDFRQQLSNGKDREVLSCSSVPHLASDGSKYQLEYVYDDLILVHAHNLRDIATKCLRLSRDFNPKLARLAYAKPSQSLTLNTYKQLRSFYRKLANNGVMPCEELSWLLMCGNPEVIHKYAHLLHEGANGISKNVAAALTKYRDAGELGYRGAWKNFSDCLLNHVFEYFYGLNGINKNIDKAIEIYEEAYHLGGVWISISNSLDSIQDERSLDFLREAKRGGCEIARDFPRLLAIKATNLYNAENASSTHIIRSIELFKEAIKLGFKQSEWNLAEATNRHAILLFKGEMGFVKNMPKAIEIFREAITLGSELAVRNLPVFLWRYAQNLRLGENGIVRDMLAAIVACREASTLGNREAIECLPNFLKDYSLWLYKGENGITKDIPRAVETCREAVKLGNLEAKGFFPTLLNNYAAWLFRGENGIEQNLAMAVEFCREAASLGHEKTRLKLPVYLNTYASALFEGKCNVPQDIPHAIEVCREAAGLGSEDAIRNLLQMTAVAQAQGLI